MEIPTLSITGEWTSVFNRLETILPEFLRKQRWFGGKARQISRVRIEEAIRIPHDSEETYVVLTRVDYAEGVAETYAIPLTFVTAAGEDRIEDSNAALAKVTTGAKPGFICTGIEDAGFCRALLRSIENRERFRGERGEIRGVPTSVCQQVMRESSSELVPSVMSAEQSNSSIRFGDRAILKLFRRLDEGINPDLEIGAFLTERSFSHIPPVAGSLEYVSDDGGAFGLGILQGFIKNRGDAWRYTLEEITGYYLRVCGLSVPREPFRTPGIDRLLKHEADRNSRDLIGGFLDQVHLLGQRTAEMHIALSSDLRAPDFAPEPFTLSYQESLFRSMQKLAAQTFKVLREQISALPDDVQAEAQMVLALEAQVSARFDQPMDQPMAAERTRVHGDYHLGQVLFTGNDFVIIDFEGEPARPIKARRIKRSPLRDVAGMLRSFHYAAFSSLIETPPGAGSQSRGFAALEPWAKRWYAAVGSTFLRGYLASAEGSGFLPRSRRELAVLLDLFCLEKAIYEVAYELNNRPLWLRIPLRGILSLMQEG